ncbi:hypothetical protein N0V93_002037 [Gnomoniopsis smithogilvyi]|uniref:Uncharacterized protein n=1 Tax=Gnomoniopsis smithogilvyi TaxID=1191159 RepID=A0A9W8Z4U3_9PEZI|nr:hypothetical protein N0V93_002037 [Gnomoniopsis smithogilvyi]
MAANLLDLTRNYSLYTIPAAWVVAIAPHFYAASLGGKAFDNRSPRTYTSSLKDNQALDAATKQRIIRAEGAQQNGFENVGLFAAAVVAANIAKVDNWTLNALSGGYLASRVLYNLVYINNETDSMAGARSAAFLSGIGMIFTLFIKSGNALRNHL